MIKEDDKEMEDMDLNPDDKKSVLEDGLDLLLDWVQDKHFKAEMIRDMIMESRDDTRYGDGAISALVSVKCKILKLKGKQV